MKGQAEIVIVLAAIILVITLVTLVLQTGLNPPDITNLASTFRDELNRKLYDGSFGVVKAVSEQGGILDPTASSTDFAGKKVQYWQVCENKAIPSLADIRKNIKAGVERLVNNLNINQFQGKAVKLELKNLDVIIRNQDILVTLTLDTSLAGYTLDSVYEIRIPANLAEVYNFASDFVTDNSVNRHFERFLLPLFFKTDEKTLPTSGVLTKCGEIIFRTWDDIKQAVEKIRDYSFINTIFWQQGNDEFKYYLPTVNGKKYESLKINFFGGDLTKANLQLPRNPITIINSKIFTVLTPFCVKDYRVDYSMNSPVIVSVGGTTDYNFKFAILPFIENNKIGKCSVQEDFANQADVCIEGKCEVNLKVFDQQNNPVPETEISFGSCYIGKTDIRGQVKGKVPCGISELNVYNPKYFYSNQITSARSIPQNITLGKISPVNIHFYRGDTNIKITADLIGNKHISQKITSIETGQILGDYIFATFKPKNSFPWSQKEFVISNAGLNKSVVVSQLVDYLPPDNYTVEITTQKKGTLSITICKPKLLGLASDCDTTRKETVFMGKVDYDFVLEEGTKDLYITSLIPKQDVSSSSVEWDYTPFLGDVTRCLQPVSTDKPQGVCKL